MTDKESVVDYLAWVRHYEKLIQECEDRLVTLRRLRIQFSEVADRDAQGVPVTDKESVEQYDAYCAAVLPVMQRLAGRLNPSAEWQKGWAQGATDGFLHTLNAAGFVVEKRDA